MSDKTLTKLKSLYNRLGRIQVYLDKGISVDYYRNLKSKTLKEITILKLKAKYNLA